VVEGLKRGYVAETCGKVHDARLYSLLKASENPGQKSAWGKLLFLRLLSLDPILANDGALGTWRGTLFNFWVVGNLVIAPRAMRSGPPRSS
jgi:hypothetical protein